MTITSTREVTTIVEVENQVKFEGATLLSYEEASKYLTETEREFPYRWWTRSVSQRGSHPSSRVVTVLENGTFHKMGMYVATDSSYENVEIPVVRPALKIYPANGLKIGDIFKIKDYTFKVISDDLAWMIYDHIGSYTYDPHKEGLCVTGVYARSAIKKVVDQWYEKLME